MALAKNVLVTGGCGFVGSHLVDALLANGHNVRVLDNLDPQVHGNKVPDYLHPDAELVRGNIQDSAAVAKALRGIDVVFHLAAVVGVGQSMYEISRYVETNTYGTAVLLQALLNRQSKVQKLVIASSMSIYGEGKYTCDKCGVVTPPLRPAQQLQEKQWEMVCSQCGTELKPIPTDETKPLQCSSIYALSKKDQEEMSLLFGRTYNLPVVALRYFNIYGPRQALSNPYTGVAAIFASRLLNANPPLVFEDGNQMRDFVSVNDVVQANIMAMEHSAGDGTALNIGSGQPISISDVARVLGSALHSNIHCKLTDKYRAGDIRHCFADISAAKACLGYKPRVQFSDGVKDLVGWLKSQNPTDRVVEAFAQLNSFGLAA
ncbi:MAG TPA: NAD-dependent epimerase/dehydratase family protein [Candidatus Angelobacter sp.]|jgi:dTDP-L-rhamnose 4-epimerase|nr:NAD-dependent epimerase/dehydratase family protein [Candidatus Angelobacter sp.]